MMSATAVGQPPASDSVDQRKVEQAASLLEIVWEADPATAQRCLRVIAQRWRDGALSPAAQQSLEERLQPRLLEVLEGDDQQPLFADACLLAGCWKHPAAVTQARRILLATERPPAVRLEALGTLLAADDAQALEIAASVLGDRRESLEVRGPLLSTLGRLESTAVANLILRGLAQWEPELRPRAIELLTQRPAWSLRLLEAVGEKRVDPQSINANQLRQLAASRDPRVRQLVEQQWGAVRQQRNPQREQVVAQIGGLLREKTGNPHLGQQIFQRVCGQCHRIYGAGQDVGPDISVNGRASLAQLLSNVLDPSLVIGAAYQARTVATEGGRVLSGLLVEDSGQRVVLKTQGGKLEVIARSDVAEINVSQLSLMPEGLERQLTPDEIVDLFAFLMLDRPPSDANARRIAGAEDLPGP